MALKFLQSIWLLWSIRYRPYLDLLRARSWRVSYCLQFIAKDLDGWKSFKWWADAYLAVWFAIQKYLLQGRQIHWCGKSTFSRKILLIAFSFYKSKSFALCGVRHSLVDSSTLTYNPAAPGSSPNCTIFYHLQLN